MLTKAEVNADAAKLKIATLPRIDSEVWFSPRLGVLCFAASSKMVRSIDVA